MRNRVPKTQRKQNNSRNNNYSLSNEISNLRNQIKSQKPKKSGKTLITKGVDYIKQIDVFPVQLLDGSPKDGTKLVASYDITPSAFPNTRLELMSNTYQMYRFRKLKVSFTSSLPTAVNGLFLAFVDTDPKDAITTRNSTELLRIAQSHQGAKQGKIRDNWSFEMPQRADDQFFFIGNNGDERFRSMGKILIYQLGQATKFDGTPLTEELSAGALNLHWTCEFMNPQLQQLDRIYDSISQKDILRTFKNLTWYRTFASTSNAAAQIPGTRFRQVNIRPQAELFVEQGDYQLVIVPTKMTTSHMVKSYNTLSLPYSNGQYAIPGTDIHTAVTNAKLTVKAINDFMKEAFQIAKGGIEVAKTIFDVISIASSVFVKDLPLDNVDTEVIDDPEDTDLEHSHESLPLGAIVVHFDGQTRPLIQTLIEYQDIAHATAAPTASYECLILAYKIDEQTENMTPPILPYLPSLE